MIKIVLVEDDEVLRKGLADYLRLSGMAVSDVASGLALYQRLSAERFDVAILDVNLPDASGFDLAKDLRAKDGMGIIILTARTTRDDRLRAYEDGADIFLSKPVDGRELALAVTNLAERVRQAATTETQNWQLLSQPSRLVGPGERQIELTSRELLLIELLAEAEGEVVNRAQLEHILGFDDKETISRGLDAMTRRLRSKARLAGLELPVQVIRSVGLRVTHPLRKA